MRGMAKIVTLVCLLTMKRLERLDDPPLSNHNFLDCVMDVLLGNTHSVPSFRTSTVLGEEEPDSEAVLEEDLAAEVDEAVEASADEVAEAMVMTAHQRKLSVRFSSGGSLLLAVAAATKCLYVYMC